VGVRPGLRQLFGWGSDFRRTPAAGRKVELNKYELRLSALRGIGSHTNGKDSMPPAAGRKDRAKQVIRTDEKQYIPTTVFRLPDRLRHCVE
jgi:hypothetical protein